MNVLREAMRLLTQPPGDLVYFLVTLFALQQALLPALNARQAPSRPAQARRWVWAAGGMLVGRAVLIVLGLLGNNELLDPALSIPPLERFLEVAGILLMLWAFLGARAARWQTVLLVPLLVISQLAYAYTAYTWLPLEAAGQAFNGTFLDSLWTLVALALLLVGFIVTPLLRFPEWEWAEGLLLFWLVGQIAQLLLPDLQSHIPGWGRLAALVTLPLLATLVQRQLATLPTTLRAPTLDPTALQELIQGVETGRDLEPALIMASTRLAELVEADSCAIALATNGDKFQLPVVAIHPPTATQNERPTLDLGTFVTLAEAWSSRQPRIIQPPAAPTWLRALYDCLGLTATGPLLVLPLVYREERVGLLLFGNQESGRRWNPNALEAPNLIAALLTGAIRVQRQTAANPLRTRLRGQDEERQQLEQTLRAAQEQVQALTAQLETARRDLRSQEAELARVNRELETHGQPTSETELSFWQNEVKELVQDRDILLEQQVHLSDRLNQTQQALEAATEEQEHLTQRLTQLQAELEAARRIPQTAGPAERPGANAAVGLVIVDEEGEITMADALARQLLRLPQGDVVGLPISGAYADPRWAQAVQTLFSAAPDTPRRLHLSLNHEGSAVEADLVALVGRDGKPDGLAITLGTEESAIERREAIAGLANDLRTPMTAMVGYTDLLLGEQVGILNEMQRQFLVRIKANVEQMGRLLNDLLRLTSPDSRRLELVPEPVDLITTVQTVLTALAARFNERRLKVRLNFPPQIAPLRVDRDSLYQIMLRLLSNAALCSQEGSEILVEAREESAATKDNPPYISVSVTDTGGGIAPEDLARVFRRFYRAGQPLIAGMGETGVGMAVAKTLVEANGGRIWVESLPGEGSTFNFALPAFWENRDQ